MEVSNQRFAWLLTQRKYRFWGEDQLEDKIKTVQITKRPDFYVEASAKGDFIAEIKSFKQQGPFKGIQTKVISSDPEPIFKRIRTAVKEAADQLRPYETLNIPMIVVLDDWQKVGIWSNVLDLRNALFGTLSVRKPVYPSGSPGRWHHGKGQQLNENLGNYISAVAWNLPKNQYPDDPIAEERTMYLRMVHNPFANILFPIDLFNNGDDEHHGYKEGRWTNLLKP
jgi:hypothetical protein